MVSKDRQHNQTNKCLCLNIQCVPVKPSEFPATLHVNPIESPKMSLSRTHSQIQLKLGNLWRTWCIFKALTPKWEGKSSCWWSAGLPTQTAASLEMRTQIFVVIVWVEAFPAVLLLQLLCANGSRGRAQGVQCISGFSARRSTGGMGLPPTRPHNNRQQAPISDAWQFRHGEHGSHNQKYERQCGSGPRVAWPHSIQATVSDGVTEGQAEIECAE